MDACEELCGLISAKYEDELHVACAEPYYQYATALLELAREEAQLLGSNLASENTGKGKNSHSLQYRLF